MTRWLVPLLSLAVVACGDSSASPDSGVTADTGFDAADAAEDADVIDEPADAVIDTSETDATVDAPELPDVEADADASPEADAEHDADVDAAAPDVGTAPFGEITGACGVVGGELDSAESSHFVAAIDFGDDPFDDPADVPRLTAGGQDVLEAGTTGGSSIYSEVFAFEVLARCDGAALLETEGSIEYRPEHTGSITDFLVELDGQQVGVSVTRAVGFPRDDPYTVDAAASLLADKLADVLESSAGVSDEDAWVKQVLVVIAYADQHVTSLEAALARVDDEVAAATVVYIVESRGDDAWLY